MSSDRQTLEAIRRLLGEHPDAPSPPPAPPGLTFAEVWARYWDEDARALKSARDIARIGQELCRFWGPRPALEVTTALAERYRDRREGVTTRLGDRVSDQTIDNELSQARRCLNWACDQKPPILPYNPLARVKLRRPDNARKSKLKTAGDLQRLLSHCDLLLEALVLVYLDSGLRRMEAISLQWAQIEVVNKRARVELWKTKTKKRRHSRLSLRAYAALLRLPRVSRYVFANPQTKRPYSARWLYKRFQDAVDAAGIEGVDGERICFHTLRHSFAYLRRTRDKLPRQAIMAQGGWVDPKVFDRYGIPDDDELDDAYDVIDRNNAAEWSKSGQEPDVISPTCETKSPNTRPESGQ